RGRPPDGPDLLRGVVLAQREALPVAHRVRLVTPDALEMAEAAQDGFGAGAAGELEPLVALGVGHRPQLAVANRPLTKGEVEVGTSIGVVSSGGHETPGQQVRRCGLASR